MSASNTRPRSSDRLHLRALLLLSVALPAVALPASVVMADPVPQLPSGSAILAGQVHITSDGRAMTVTQSSDRMIATWDSFSIGTGATVRFDQPGAASVALNRVTGSGLSAIDGTLSANGQVFLVNPSGILFGAGARVAVGGAFVASTLDIDNRDFLAGRYAFSGTGGEIRNSGTIEGPVLAMIAPVVRNDGTMRGSTALAAGTDVALDFTGDGLLSVEVLGSTMATLAENSGVIEAPGGVVVMTARGASAAKAGVVNNTGRIEARALASRNGRILLTADMGSGSVRAGGSLRARSVETSAARVEAAPGLSVQTDGGLWTIDPTDITVNGTMATALAAALQTGDALVETSGTGTGRGDIIINGPIDWTDTTLTLKAHASVIIDAPLSVDGTGGLVIDYNSRGWPFDVANWDRGQITVNAPLAMGPDTHLTTITGPGDLGPFGPPRDTRMFQVLTSRADMAAIAGDPGGSFVLGNDIDLSGSGPLVAAGTPFTGVLEGFGHALTGVRIEQPGVDNVGLFPQLSQATVRNLTLVGAVVSGQRHVGALAGTASASVAHNLRVTSTVSSQFRDSVGRDADINTGGIIGRAGSTVLSNILADVTVRGTFDVGGIAGSGGIIVRSEARGTVTGSQGVGGISGGVGQISDSATYVNVMAVPREGNFGLSNPDFIGGASGAAGIGPQMTNVLVAGTVTVVTDPSRPAPDVFEFHAPVAPGRVLGPVDDQGLATTAETFSFYLDSGLPPQGRDTFPGTEITPAAARNAETYTNAGWDFVRTWGISPELNDGLPVIRALYPGFRFDSGSKLLVTVPSQTRTYGDANPLLDGLWRVDGCDDCVAFVDWGPMILPQTNAGSYAYGAPGVLNVVLSPTETPDDYDITFAPGALAITPRVLTAGGIVVADKTYDGTTAVIALDAEGTVDGVLFGDGVFLRPLVEDSFFADRNAGAGVSVAVALALEGVPGKVQNYTLDRPFFETAANILRRPAGLFDVVVAQTRPYDGTTLVEVTEPGELFGILPADQASLELGVVSATVSEKSVGTGKPVTVAASIFGGSVINNYDIAMPAGLTTAITPRDIMIRGSFSAEKEYDGSAAVSAFGTASLVPDPARVVAGDDLTVDPGAIVGRFDSRNAGENKQVFLEVPPGLGGADALNYRIVGDLPVGSGRITPKPLDLFGALVADKTYDGTLVATVASAGVLEGVVAGDAVSHRLVSAFTVFGEEPPRFSDRHAGPDKVVGIGVRLIGADAGNYRAPGQQTATATIHPKPLALAGLDFGSGRAYDGTATVDPVFAGELVGIEPIDVAEGAPTVADLTGSLADKSAGENRPLTVTGTLTGVTAGNYRLDLPQELAVTIAPREIALAGIFTAEKEYDGTVAASAASLDSLMLDPARVIGSDSVALDLAGLAARFDNRNAGDGKRVFLDAVPGLTGADAGNYALSTALPVGVGRITPKPLTLSEVFILSRDYDSTTRAQVALTGGLGGVVTGDAVSHRLVSGLGDGQEPPRFADKSAANDKPVPIEILLDGADAGNYRAPAPQTARASIFPRLIPYEPVLPDLTKTYDGSTVIPITGAVFPDIAQLVFPGDEVLLESAAVMGQFADKTAGDNKPLALQNLELAGPDAGNYRLWLSTLRGRIEPAPLALSGTTVSDKLFDGRRDATVVSPGSLSGVLAGDEVLLTGTVAEFVDPEPGIGKTVEVILVSLAGADFGNYVLDPESLPQTTATIFSPFQTVPGPVSPGQPSGHGLLVDPDPTDPGPVLELDLDPAPGTFVEEDPLELGDGEVIFGDGDRSIEIQPGRPGASPTGGAGPTTAAETSGTGTAPDAPSTVSGTGPVTDGTTSLTPPPPTAEGIDAFDPVELGDGDAPISEPLRESDPTRTTGPVASAPQEAMESPPAIDPSEARTQAIEDEIARLARRNADLDESLENSRAEAARLEETRSSLTFRRFDLLEQLEANPDSESLKNALARVEAEIAAVDREAGRVGDLIRPVLREIAANVVLILWNEDQLRRIDTGQAAQTAMVEDSGPGTSDLPVGTMTEAEKRTATEDARNRLEAAETAESQIRERLGVLGTAIERAAIAFAEAQRVERQLSNALEGSAPVGVNLGQVERLLVAARDRMDSALRVIRAAMQEQAELETQLDEQTAAGARARRDLAALGASPRSGVADERLPDGLDLPGDDMPPGLIDLFGTGPEAPTSDAPSQPLAESPLQSQDPVDLATTAPGNGTAVAADAPTATPQGPVAPSDTPSTAELFAAGGLSVADLRRFLDAVYEHMVLKQARLDEARAEDARLRTERAAAEAAGDNARAEDLEARIVRNAAFIAGETTEIAGIQGFLAGNLPFSALPQGLNGTAEQLVRQRAVDSGFLGNLYSGSGGPSLADRPDLATLALGPAAGANLADHGVDPEKLTRFVSAFSGFLTQSREYLAIARKRLEFLESSGGSADARTAEEARIRELEADVDLAERFLNGEAALAELDQARLNRVFTSVPVVFAWAGFGDTLRRFDPNSLFHQRGLAALAPPPPETESVPRPALMRPTILQDQRIPRSQDSESFDLLQMMLGEGDSLAFETYGFARDVLAPEVRNVIDEAYARSGTPPVPLSRGVLLVLRDQLLGREDIVFPDSRPSFGHLSD